LKSQKRQELAKLNLGINERLTPTINEKIRAGQAAKP
jgi:hypothetical protein